MSDGFGYAGQDRDVSDLESKSQNCVVFRQNSGSVSINRDI